MRLPGHSVLRRIVAEMVVVLSQRGRSPHRAKKERYEDELLVRE